GEELRGHVLTGFPWNTWALPLTAVPSIAQPAGVYGATTLGFVVALLAAATVDLLRGPRRRGVIAFAGAVVFWGAGALWMAARPAAEGQALKVALIQGNIEQDQNWSPD